MTMDICLNKQPIGYSPFNLNEFKTTSPLKRFNSLNKQQLLNMHQDLRPQQQNRAQNSPKRSGATTLQPHQYEQTDLSLDSPIKKSNSSNSPLETQSNSCRSSSSSLSSRKHCASPGTPQIPIYDPGSNRLSEPLYSEPENAYTARTLKHLQEHRHLHCREYVEEDTVSNEPLIEAIATTPTPINKTLSRPAMLSHLKVSPLRFPSTLRPASIPDKSPVSSDGHKSCVDSDNTTYKLKSNVKVVASDSCSSTTSPTYDSPCQHEPLLYVSDSKQNPPSSQNTWNSPTHSTDSPKRSANFPMEFKMDVERTRNKLREVQQRFLGISRKSPRDEEPRPRSPSPLSQECPEESYFLSPPFALNANALENQCPVHQETNIRSLLERLKGAEEKVVELETDKEFLVRECQQLKERLAAVSRREEELQMHLGESRLTALRDKQALEARHRDSITELRRLLHEEASKVESLQERLREVSADEFYEEKVAQFLDENASFQGGLENPQMAEQLQSMTLKLTQQSDELYYWKNECSKHVKLREKEELEFFHELEDKKNTLFTLKIELEEAHSENVRLTSELKKKKKMLESLLHQHDTESKACSRTIQNLEKKIQLLQSDCHRFQKIIKRKESEMASEIASLCNRFSDLENQYEAEVSQRITEREMQLRKDLERHYHAQLEGDRLTIKNKYERLFKKYKHQRYAIPNAYTAGSLKTFIKSEITKAVAQSMNVTSDHLSPQLLRVTSSSCQEKNTTGPSQCASTFLLGTAIAADAKLPHENVPSGHTRMQYINPPQERTSCHTSQTRADSSTLDYEMPAGGKSRQLADLERPKN